jgi:S-adenosylmethionine hydrolase
MGRARGAIGSRAAGRTHRRAGAREWPPPRPRGAPPIVTLTTDFGTTDWYAGAVRGAILSRCARAQIVDITHDVPPHDVSAGAFALTAVCTAFPAGTVHLAVVDPGVGGARRPLVLLAGTHAFVGPDNGLLAHAALRLAGNREAVRAFVLDPLSVIGKGGGLSHTFHGRDLFAPVAALLAAGRAPKELGTPCRDWMSLPFVEPLVQSSRNAVLATVLHVDRFGNAVTNLRSANAVHGALRAFIKGRLIAHQASSYDAVPRGTGLLIAGSAGFIEVAVREGRADEIFGLSRGSTVTITFARHPPLPGDAARRRRTERGKDT